MCGFYLEKPIYHSVELQLIREKSFQRFPADLEAVIAFLKECAKKHQRTAT